MAIRSTLISFCISVMVMALGMELIDRGTFDTTTFQGKIIFSVAIILVTKILSKVLGG